MADLHSHSYADAKKGRRVTIKTDDGVQIDGDITEILSTHDTFAGIRVRLTNGKVGRIQRYVQTSASEATFRRHLSCPESSNLEFKASLLFDYGAYDHNHNVKRYFYDGPHSIAKTIAAFANTEGGILYIGIRDDDRTVLGLNKDYDLLKTDLKISSTFTMKENEKKLSIRNNGEFLFALKQFMEKLLEKEDYLQYAKPEIMTLPEGEICVIKVDPSPRPLIVSKDQFYVRHGDQSERYDTVYRFIEYWCEHLSKMSRSSHATIL